jgi:predicted RNA-binding Zn-ribbon protein involved in translation (DUF1610 family)
MLPRINVLPTYDVPIEEVRHDRFRSEADAAIRGCRGSCYLLQAGTVAAAKNTSSPSIWTRIAAAVRVGCSTCGKTTFAATSWKLGPRCGEEEARRSRRSRRLPHGGSLRLCGRTRSGRRAQALPGRETERDRPCRFVNRVRAGCQALGGGGRQGARKPEGRVRSNTSSPGPCHQGPPGESPEGLFFGRDGLALRQPRGNIRAGSHRLVTPAVTLPRSHRGFWH